MSRQRVLHGKAGALVRDRAKRLEAAKTPHQEIDELVRSNRAIWSGERCKVCQSTYRADVDLWRKDGDPYRTIAARLKDRGVDISPESVRRHCDNHVGIADLVLDETLRNHMQVREAADADTTDLERLDALIKRLSRVEKRLSIEIERRATRNETLPTSVAQAYQTAVSELRQAIALRAKLTLGQPADDVDRLLMALWQAEPQTRTTKASADHKADPGEQAATQVTAVL